MTDSETIHRLLSQAKTGYFRWEKKSGSLTLSPYLVETLQLKANVLTEEDFLYNYFEILNFKIERFDSFLANLTTDETFLVGILDKAQILRHFEIRSHIDSKGEDGLPATIDCLVIEKDIPQNYAHALKTSEIGTFYLNLINQKLFWDAGSQQIFGVQQENHPPNDFLNFLANDGERERITKIYMEAFNNINKNYTEYDYQIVTPKGITKTVQSRVNFFRNKHGVPLWVEGININATQDKKTANEFATIFRSLPCLAFCFKTDGEVTKVFETSLPSSTLLDKVDRGFIVKPKILGQIKLDDLNSFDYELTAHPDRPISKCRFLRIFVGEIWKSEYFIFGLDITNIYELIHSKSMLMQEIHHRVKNNFQIISSLIGIKAAKENSQILYNTLKEIQSKVFTMGLVHQGVYKNQVAGTFLDLEFHLHQIKDFLITQGGSDWPINFICLSANKPFEVEMNYAIYLGLIFNELATNSIKHNIGNRPEGINIGYCLHHDSKGGYILYTDDGDFMSMINIQINKLKNRSGFDLIKLFAESIGARISLLSFSDISPRCPNPIPDTFINQYFYCITF